MKAPPKLSLSLSLYVCVFFSRSLIPLAHSPLGMTSPLYLFMCLFICIWLLTSISDYSTLSPPVIWLNLSFTFVAFTFIHTNTHTLTSFIRLSIHWIARVQLLLNCRLVVPFFAVISPLHVLFVLLFLASFCSAHAEQFNFLPWSQYSSYRFWLAICVCACLSSVCIVLFRFFFISQWIN